MDISIGKSRWSGLKCYDIKNKYCFHSLKIVLVLANSAEPDDMAHSAAFHLRLHRLPKYPFSSLQSTEGSKRDFTPRRRQSKIEQRGSKIARNCVFGYHLSPVRRQMEMTGFKRQSKALFLPIFIYVRQFRLPPTPCGFIQLPPVPVWGPN